MSFANIEIRHGDKIYAHTIVSGNTTRFHDFKRGNGQRFTVYELTLSSNQARILPRDVPMSDPKPPIILESFQSHSFQVTPISGIECEITIRFYKSYFP